MAAWPSRATVRSSSGLGVVLTLVKRSLYVRAEAQNEALFWPVKPVSTGRMVVVGPVEAGVEAGAATFFCPPPLQPASRRRTPALTASALGAFLVLSPIVRPAVSAVPGHIGRQPIGC